MTKTYSGKLLLTGEYFILDGVPGLAVPTRPGQTFTVRRGKPGRLVWRAVDHRGEEWFRGSFHPDSLQLTPAVPNPVHDRLERIFFAADELRPGTYDRITKEGYSVTTELQFDRGWGLGTSSTLIAGVAKWLAVNPYALLEKTFGGSGYDLACATAKGPIVYERAGIEPVVTPVKWKPDWLARTHFVYLNEKQDSREGIRAYRAREVPSSTQESVTALTNALISETLHLRDAQKIVKEHERIVAKTLGLSPVQAARFPDFSGQLKSLGAWGGDFIWALSDAPSDYVEKYFNDRGFGTVLTGGDLLVC